MGKMLATRLIQAIMKSRVVMCVIGRQVTKLMVFHYGSLYDVSLKLVSLVV